MMRLLLIAFLLEVGFMLIVLPWSVYWDHNYFASALPPLHALITNNFARGAVSGLGVINMIAAVVDLLAPVFARRPARRSHVSISPSATAEE